LPTVESPFFIIIFHFSFVKAGVNASCLCKLRKDCLAGTGPTWRNGVKTTPTFLHFPLVKGRTRTIAHMPIAKGLSFRSLDGAFTIGKCGIKKKIYSQVCNEFSPPISKLVA
jgi:hypothetical protein